MANTLITKLVGGAAIVAVALSTLIAPGAASASTPRVHQTKTSVFSVASREAAARAAAARARVQNHIAHKIVQRDLRAERSRAIRLAAAKRAAAAAHRRRVIATKIAINRAHRH